MHDRVGLRRDACEVVQSAAAPVDRRVGVVARDLRFNNAWVSTAPNDFELTWGAKGLTGIDCDRLCPGAATRLPFEGSTSTRSVAASAVRTLTWSVVSANRIGTVMASEAPELDWRLAKPSMRISMRLTPLVPTRFAALFWPCLSASPNL